MNRRGAPARPRRQARAFLGTTPMVSRGQQRGGGSRGERVRRWLGRGGDGYLHRGTTDDSVLESEGVWISVQIGAVVSEHGEHRPPSVQQARERDLEVPGTRYARVGQLPMQDVRV